MSNRSKYALEDCTPGETYVVGYRLHQWPAKFVKWLLDSDNKPRMIWEDTTSHDQWDAYLFNGRFCIGSSADPLYVVWG